MLLAGYAQVYQGLGTLVRTLRHDCVTGARRGPDQKVERLPALLAVHIREVLYDRSSLSRDSACALCLAEMCFRSPSFDCTKQLSAQWAERAVIGTTLDGSTMPSEPNAWRT